MSARQFGKVYWDEPGSPAARLAASYVRYRCHDGPRVIVRAEFQEALRVGVSATKRAIAEAEELGLIYRRPSRRAGDHNKHVYSIAPFAEAQADHEEDVGRKSTEVGSKSTHGGSEIDRGRFEIDTRKSTEVGSKSTHGGSEIDRGRFEIDRGRSEFEPAHGGPEEQVVEQGEEHKEQLVEHSAHHSSANNTLFDRHEEIARQQAQLAEERRNVREESKRDPANAVTSEYVAAIRGAGPAWALLLEHDVAKRHWQRDLGKLIAELGLTADPLTPDQVGAVLRAWNAEAERHGDREVEAGHVRGVPPRQWLWKPQHRAWVLGAIKASARSSKPPAADPNLIGWDDEYGPIFKENRW